MARSSQKHLLFLDGLRGLAALYVVAHHALLQITLTYPRAELSTSFLFFTRWLLFGQMSVDIFIVLSGFCLMLPIARGDGSLGGGFLQFAKRRAWRLLPPYYASIVLSLFLIWLIPSLSHFENSLWSLSLPAFSSGVIISHLFLVHNLSAGWLHKINYPLWSVATEWQIYFVFALLLLPILRRYGITVMIISACFVSFLPRLFFHHQLDAACFHFLILFAFGMGAAVLAFSNEAVYKKEANRAVWAKLGIIATIVFCLLAAVKTDWLLAHFTIHDVLVGIATAAMLLTMARRSQEMPQQIRLLDGAVHILEARPVVLLGTFSYSLYLVHAPLLALVNSAVSRIHMPAALCFLTCETVGIPVCLISAYIFHLAFERPFMSKPKPRTEEQAEIAAVVSPAP